MKNSNLKELYEVFRVESGVALFLEDHIERLFSGAKKAGIALNAHYQEIMEYLLDFLNNSNILKGNVRLSFYFDPQNKISVNYQATFIPHKYPDKQLYVKGISCLLMHSERDIPEAKIANTLLRDKTNKLISQKSVFETLLVDRHGKITEGSRSNLFFIKNNVLITAPDNKVLPGIVRKKTIALAKEINIPIDFRCIDAAQELKKMDAAFITGTSPRILPVKSIENIILQPGHPIIENLMRHFDSLVKQYIISHKKAG